MSCENSCVCTIDEAWLCYGLREQRFLLQLDPLVYALERDGDVFHACPLRLHLTLEGLVLFIRMLRA